MEQKVYKIFWRIGQEITPETFIQADNYICSQHNLIRRLIASDNYGLLPQTEADTPSLSIQTNVNNKDIYIEKFVCSGTTRAGYLIEMENHMMASLPKKYLSIPDSDAKSLYLVLRVNPFEQVLIEPVKSEAAPAAHSIYELNIRELGQIGENELAIIKIDNSNNAPVIDHDYIPPCMSVNACSKLLEIYKLLKQLLSEILSHIEHKGYMIGTAIYPLSMLHDEFDNFSLLSPPIALIQLMKKIVRTYQVFIPDIKTINLPDFLREYNHNDVSITFKSLLSCLQNIAKIIGQGKEEDFTPKI